MRRSVIESVTPTADCRRRELPKASLWSTIEQTLTTPTLSTTNVTLVSGNETNVTLSSLTVFVQERDL